MADSSSAGMEALRELLASANKEQFIDALLTLNIRSPSDLAQANLDDLGTAMPKSIARILRRRASMHLSKPEELEYEVHLTQDQIAQVREIWRGLKATREQSSFGARFYEIMLAMDKHAMRYFPGVDLEILGRDFDEELDLFIQALDDKTAFQQQRDSFVDRLVHYRLSLRSLWMAADAFEFAAVTLYPEMDMTRNLGVWTCLFRSIIPPFHPSILKSMTLPTAAEQQSKTSELASLVEIELAQRGFGFYAMWLKEHAGFFPCLEKAAIALVEWQGGSGQWACFLMACNNVVAGMPQEEMQLKMLCAEIPDIVTEFMGEEYGSKLTNVLLVIGCMLHGIEKLNEGIRESQKEIVSNTWDYIYRRTSKEFGERFYDEFTKNPKISRIFQRTDFAMQRQHFVHQFNVILLRINEDVVSVLRPLLIELGARHRLHYLVGIKEMIGVLDPLLETMREMLGTTNWTIRTSDAWAFCVNVILRFMVVGWTCGVGLIDPTKKAMVIQHAPTASKLSKAANIALLKTFRDEEPEMFPHFFKGFAGNVDAEHAEVAALRYEKIIDRILDETDVAITLDRLHALGSRHVRHHGVSLADLSSAASAWMSTADIVFGKRFSTDVALEWARLWVMIATSMLPAYMGDDSCPTVEELFAPFRVEEVGGRSGAAPLKMARLACMTLTQKSVLPGRVANFVFECDVPIRHKAGQYAKIRFELPDGRRVSRYYSIASHPDPVSGMAKSLELCIKAVPNGCVSPFLIDTFEPPANCYLVMAAGHFVLPETVGDMNRMMVSGGIGIVAFIGVVRSVAAQRRAGLLKNKTMFVLIHCERYFPFAFSEELFALSNEFAKGKDELFRFDFTLCLTRGSELEAQRLSDKNISVETHTSRVDERILSSSLRRFTDSSNTDVYLCGPGAFQKAVRDHLSQRIGHSTKLIHQEFFDL